MRRLAAKLVLFAMVRTGLYKASEVDLSKVATTQFVNQDVGVALRKQFTGHSARFRP